jgi:hypothetical protein
MASLAENLTARLRALPEGAILKHAFYGLVALTGVLVFTDLREAMTQAESSFGLPLRDPVTMERPSRDDQVRPYLPLTRPLAPGEEPGPMRDRPRDAAEAQPMQFRLGTHGAAFAEGTITPGSADELQAFLDSDRAASVTEIVLHSPGGSVTDAAAMARLIRERGLGTRILADGYCASSCPLVFAGGKERVADRTAWIGVHQVFAVPNALGSLADGFDQGQRSGAEAQTLLIEFGVDPRVWTHAMATPKDQLYLFTPDELVELKLATQLEGKAPPTG